MKLRLKASVGGSFKAIDGKTYQIDLLGSGYKCDTLKEYGYQTEKQCQNAINRKLKKRLETKKAHIRRSASMVEFDSYETWAQAVKARQLRISQPVADAENGPSGDDFEQTLYAYYPRKSPEGRYLNDTDATTQEQYGCFDIAFDKGVLFDTPSEFTSWMNEGDQPWDAMRDAF